MPYAERILKKFEYTVRDRTFNLASVPVRIDWKGNPIKQTPRGTTGIAYQIFDITKARQGEADPVSNEIWRLYEQTESLPDVVGTPAYATTSAVSVPDIISSKERMALRRSGVNYSWMEDEDFLKERVRLNTEQINRLMRISGKERYAEVEQLMASKSYQKMKDDEKIEALNEIADKYRSVKEIDNRGKFRAHTLELFKIMQEIYEAER